MSVKYEFYTFQEGLDQFAPVIPMSDLKIPWLSQSVAVYEKSSRNENLGMKPPSATHRCAGIRDLLNTGWVLTAPADFIIKTFGDGRNFEWKSRVSGHDMNLRGDYINWFDYDLHSYFMELPDNMLRSVIKVSTPWNFKCPDGWGLMMVPLNYMNETRFEAAAGIIDPKKSNELNAVLYWKVLDGETRIKAGTPLCQFIPVKLDGFKHTVREATALEKKWYHYKNVLENTWFANTAKMRPKLFDHFFKIKKCPFHWKKD